MTMGSDNCRGGRSITPGSGGSAPKARAGTEIGPEVNGEDLHHSECKGNTPTTEGKQDKRHRLWRCYWVKM